MENEEEKTQSSQKKSREQLLKILNNVGIIGAILAAIADMIFVTISVVGLKINLKKDATAVFSVMNAFIGILINFLLRYQGKKYAEIENQELCEKFYRKRIKEKKYISMEKWFVLCTIKDIVVKGSFTIGGIFGAVYISIEGSKNPVQILITAVTLVLFACFGLVNMNSAYTRFYSQQIPYMENKIKELEEKQNGIN